MNKKIKWAILLVYAIVLNLLFLIILIGKIQYNNSIRVVQNLTEKNDEDIKECLTIFYFDNLNPNKKPKLSQYFYAGWKTLNNSGL